MKSYEKSFPSSATVAAGCHFLYLDEFRGTTTSCRDVNTWRGRVRRYDHEKRSLIRRWKAVIACFIFPYQIITQTEKHLLKAS